MTNQAPILIFPYQRIPATRKYFGESWRVKRVFDILVAALGLLVLSPVLGLVAVLIKRDSAGPVFYRGRRAAKGGGEFGILKFRTMYEDKKSYAGPKVTANDDAAGYPGG